MNDNSFNDVLDILTTDEERSLSGVWMNVRMDDHELASDERKVAQLPHIRSTVNAVVEHIYTLDQLTAQLDASTNVISTHRRPWFERAATVGPNQGESKLVLGDPYWSHAIIRVSHKKLADIVEHYLNDVFRIDSRFSAKAGYRASVAYGGKPLDKSTHPFFQYLKHKNMSHLCSRFLIVVGLAKEGLNHKYVNTVGVAKSSDSMLEQVQFIGRAIRSPHLAPHGPDGQHMVPPSHLDRIKVITHHGFGVSGNIRRALNFILNMEAEVSPVMSAQEYFDQEHALEDESLSTVLQLSFFAKADIAQTVGRSLRDGKRLHAKSLIDRYGGRKVIKKNYVRETVTGLREQREGAIEEFRKSIFARELVPVRVITDETLYWSITDEELLDWINSQDLYRKTFEMFSAMNDEADAMNAMREWREKLKGSFQTHDIQVRTSPSAVLDSIVSSFVNGLNLKDLGTDIRYMVYGGACAILQQGAPDDLLPGGSLDIPAVVTTLQDDEVKMNLRGWVMRNLVLNGHLPGIYRSLRVDEILDEYENDAEDKVA